MLPPYSGFVQIAESERARAQSFDGISWEIQYLNVKDQANRQQKREQGYGLDRGFFRVANLQDNQLKPYVLPSCLDTAEVADCINELSEFLSTTQAPFPAADVFEYWLLDGVDEITPGFDFLMLRGNTNIDISRAHRMDGAPAFEDED